MRNDQRRIDRDGEIAMTAAPKGETPRTNQAVIKFEKAAGVFQIASGGPAQLVLANFARQLERELGEARAQISKLNDALNSGHVELLEAELAACRKLLLEVREFLADPQHSQWPYVENGHQSEDMHEWIQRLDAAIDMAAQGTTKGAA